MGVNSIADGCNREAGTFEIWLFCEGSHRGV